MTNIFRNPNLLFAGLFFSSVASACSPLPSDLQAYMKSLDVQYTPIDKKNLDPGILSVYEDAEVCIVDDFDGDGRTDHAVLLNSQETRFSVIAFLRREPGYVHKVLYDADYMQFFDPENIQVIMAPASGRIETVVAGESDVEIKPVQLKRTGIVLSEWMGAITKLHYWKDSEYVQAHLSD